MRSIPLSVLTVALALHSRGALAQPAPGAFSLEWEAPEGCPPRGQVEGELARLLGRPPGDLVVPLVASARARRERRGWRLEVSLSTPGQVRHRTLHGATCASVSSAAALVLALALDPEALTARAPEPSPGPAPGPAPAPSPPATGGGSQPTQGSEPVSVPGPPESPPPAPPVVPGTAGSGSPSVATSGSSVAVGGQGAPRGSVGSATAGPVATPPASAPEPVAPEPVTSVRPRAWRVRTRAEFLVDLGSLPSATYGVSGAAGFSLGALQVEGRVAWRVPQRANVGGESVEFSLLTAGLAGCALSRGRVGDLGGCLGVEVGSLRGASYGVSQPGVGPELWVAVTFGVLGRVNLGRRFATLLELGSAVPLLRPESWIPGVGTVFQPSPASLRGSLGLEVLF